MTDRQQIRKVMGWLGAWYGAFLLYGSLMPFQFAWRPLSDAWSHYLIPNTERIGSISWHDFATNFGLYIPLGFLAAGTLLVSHQRGDRGKPALLQVLVFGGLLSATIEFLQLYFPPRVSWGYDLLGNLLGLFVGHFIWKAVGPSLLGLINRCSTPANSLTRVSWSSRHKVAIWTSFVILLAFANNWYERPWLTWQEAALRLPSISLLPFYYHQEASTWMALRSVIWNFAIYLPVGFLFSRMGSNRTMLCSSGPAVAGILGAFVAGFFEAGKFFIASRHPDSGNALVGALAAVTGFLTLPCLLQLAQGKRQQDEGITESSVSALAFPYVVFAKSTAIAILLFVLAAVTNFPVAPVTLAMFLILYAAILWRWQHAWLWVLPATLPFLDLAPYTGWFFLDEFDLLILVTLAVSIWRRRAISFFEVPCGIGYWFTVLFASSTAISLVLGLWPFQPIDLNSFSHDFSHYNALRIAKGFLWALALAPLLGTGQEHQALAMRRFSVGVVIGLFGAALLALWERAVYPGLLNFASEFRIGTFFSSMHNGGSHIEAYFTMAMPFSLAWAYVARSNAVRLLLVTLFFISGYVVLVTFARGGHVAFAVTLLIVIASLGRVAYLQNRRLIFIALVGLLSTSFLLALPVLLGPFAQQRLAATGSDLGTRVEHWERSLQLMKSDNSTRLFGMGLGRFPITYSFGNSVGRMTADFRYGEDSGNRFLTLGSGGSLYVEQIVDVHADQRYRLSLDTRNIPGEGTINVLLCERTYFYSFGCASAALKHEAEPGQWAHHSTEIFSGKLGAGSWLERRAVKLSLENAKPGTTIDVDNISLKDEYGIDLVNNGDFELGRARWYFSSPFNHLPWHIKNLWVGLLFDQGWFGVLAFAGLIGLACISLGRSAWQGNLFAGAALASTVGFLCIGFFDSLFDAPRLITFLFLTLFVFQALSGHRVRHRERCWQATAASRTVEQMDGQSTAFLDPWMTRLSNSDGRYSGNRFALSPLSGNISLSVIRHIIVGVLLLAAMVWLMTHLPLAPYNLRKLPNPYHPIAASFILAVFFFWICAVPAWTARWMEFSAIGRYSFPVWVFLHGLIAWALVRNGVLPEIIHKVVGAPVLGYGGEWETLIRFAVLEGAFFTLITGGITMTRTLANRTQPNGLIAWLFWTVFLLPIAYYVIVTNAATDNLVELIACDGSKEASLLIAIWIVLIGIGASSFAKSISGLKSGGWRQLWPPIASIPLGYVVLSAGLAPAVHKYDKVFSGLQFMLSVDREHYATGWTLWFRYGIFHSVVLLTMGLTQYPLWISQKKRPPLS